MNLTNKRRPINRDVRPLIEDLGRVVAGEVRFDEATRGVYTSDASNYRQVPIGAVIPKTSEDVIRAVEVCRHHQVPIVARGGGTSLAGQCCNVAVVFDFSKYMNRVLEISAEGKWARVEPGVYLDVLRNEAKKHGLTFGPDPSTHSHCTIGGMIGNNSCGVHALMAGRMEENTHSLTALTYDGLVLEAGPVTESKLDETIQRGGRIGKLYSDLRDLRDRYGRQIRERFPNIPRRVSGYNLPELLAERSFHLGRALVGTEGTCALTLEAKVRLVPNPKHRVLVTLGYRNVYSAADHICDILSFKPIGLEGFDETLIEYLRHKHLREKDLTLLPEGQGWLLVEFGGGTPEEAAVRAEEMTQHLDSVKDGPSSRILRAHHEQERMWKLRESGLSATALVPGEPDTWPGWEDSAVAPERLGEYLRALRELMKKHGYRASLYGHFGQGCVHCRIPFDLVTADGIQNYRRFVTEAAHLVTRLGGSLSGEHGDGQARGELLPIMYGSEIVSAFQQFKRAWDPDGALNPGKVVDPYRLDENLRLGTGFTPFTAKTVFSFSEDQGDFARAATRCVGVGKCRQLDLEKGESMCPSYLATREEMHSTRGRSRLLFEMMRGDFLKDRWREDAVHEGLRLCLSCKGCKHDCPVNVDMATYKAEFYYHYYKRRLRPKAAYAMGLIPWWSRVGGTFPRLTNFLSHTSGFSQITKWAGGISQQRELPLFAHRPFRKRFSDTPRSSDGTNKEQIILWTDTFNNYFHPHVLEAGLRVLRAAGFAVRLTEKNLCCGRPFYDFGFLDLAKSYVQRIVDSLSEEIESGMPIVVLEPSCAAVFRDELPMMLPADRNAQRLSKQVFTLSQILEQRAPGFVMPYTDKAIRVQSHCHHKAVLGTEAEKSVLAKLSDDAELMPTGCCGMAGAFGFHRENFNVSKKVAEGALLPNLSGMSPDTIVLADGFSCRTQIGHFSDHRAIHLAELIDGLVQNSRDRKGNPK